MCPHTYRPCRIRECDIDYPQAEFIGDSISDSIGDNIGDNIGDSIHVGDR